MSHGEAYGALRERFYRSVAETLALLHGSDRRDRSTVLVQVAAALAEHMRVPLVWIGRVDAGDPRIDIVAAAGEARGYVDGLALSRSADVQGGQGPAGTTLRDGMPRVVTLDVADFAPWRERAERFGLRSAIFACSDTADGGQLALAAYAGDTSWTEHGDLTEWAQRLVDELARYWDHCALLARNQRLSRYRDAQRRIQRALLEQPDPRGVYRVLAESLVDIAGAAAVDVYAVPEEGPLLERMALAGPMADIMRMLPTPPREPGRGLVYTPTRALATGQPVVISRPAQHEGISRAWRLPRLRDMGALACWPIRRGDESGATAVFAVVTEEDDAFDSEMCALFDEIAETAGLALSRHEQHRELALERERQAHLARHDALTGLPNRRALEQHLDAAMERARLEGGMVATGLLDLDDFKPINDQFGHAGGDRVLVEVARRLSGAMEDGDYVARLGGDEFVLVIEGLHAEKELDVRLVRIWGALHKPLSVDGERLQLTASLGVALFPRHMAESADHLLRLADQAMYEIKMHKHRRTRWWSFPPEEDAGSPGGGRRRRMVQPHGHVAARLLEPWADAFAAQVPAIVDGFYAAIRLHDGAARLMRALPPSDVDALKQRLARHLKLLLDSRLDRLAHRDFAAREGMFYAANGVEDIWLLEAIERLRDLVAETLGSTVRRDRRPVGVVLQRLAWDRQWQLEGMRELQRRRVDLLDRLNALAWSADSYLELTQGVVDRLNEHPEVLACAIGRPDAEGRLLYEALAGEAFKDFLRLTEQGAMPGISVRGDDVDGDGPSGRAWRSVTIQRCAHFATDPSMAPWRNAATQLGVGSSVSVPLCPTPNVPIAILSIYSPFAGGFQAEDQRAFIEQVKTILDLALARLAPAQSRKGLLPFFVRDRWRSQLYEGALRMHYQPVLRLASGQVGELEALARLADTDDTLLEPARFLPALRDDDLLELFHRGLIEVAGRRQALLQAGHALDVAINVPASALRDARYIDVSREVLIDGPCPPHSILFEILESSTGADESAQDFMTDARTEFAFQALRELGVRLVEDDLGAGYSSLIRLRQWPFDRIKIDQEIVGQVRVEPLRTLRFIRQLIRLGHDLDLEVVVEGLETPGLIEAALILEADMGQGYALARPMPAEHLLSWLEGPHPVLDAARPATAMGALAGTIIWEERFLALMPDRELWRRHCESPCAAGAYLQHAADIPDDLRKAHERMHLTACDGPESPGYLAARAAFTEQLLMHLLGEQD